MAYNIIESEYSESVQYTSIRTYVWSESKPSNNMVTQLKREWTSRLAAKFPSDDVPIAAVRNKNPNSDNFGTIMKCDTEYNKLKSNNQKFATTIIEEISDPTQAQIFKYQVESDNMISLGSGSSKEEAQQNTANAFLKITNDGTDKNAITSIITNSLYSPSKEDYAMNILDVQSKMNFIGALQELCISRKWPFPDYRYKIGVHTHIVECSLNIYITKGEGTAKQAAKMQAARIMYEKVDGLLHEETVFDNTSKRLTPVKALLNFNNSVQNMEKEAQKYLEIFYENLKLSRNPSINKLLRYDSIHKSSKSSVDILNTIGEEEGFCPVYTILSSKCSEVLVELFITSFLVNFVTGKTVEIAKESAAHAALIHLKLTLKD